MMLSDYLRRHSDDFDTNDDGYAVIRLDSSMLPGVTVDTYGTFNGDSWMDCEIAWLSELGNWLDFPLNGHAYADLEWGDLDFNYDHKGILSDLADAAMDAVSGEYGDFLVDWNAVSTFSPAYYNFTTDSFAADWTIDLDAMIQRGGDIDVDALEGWARERWASCSGFISSIPRYFDNDRTWALIWAYIAKLMVEDEFSTFLDVAEAEHEAYSDNTEVTITPSGWAKIYRTITGRELDEDQEIDNEDELVAFLPNVQDETLPSIA